MKVYGVTCKVQRLFDGVTFEATVPKVVVAETKQEAEETALRLSTTRWFPCSKGYTGHEVAVSQADHEIAAQIASLMQPREFQRGAL